MANMTKTQDAIYAYMKEGREQREKMIAGFATIAEQQKSCLAYQQTCDTERKDHNGRILSLENSRTKILGIASGLSAVIAFTGWAISQWK